MSEFDEKQLYDDSESDMSLEMMEAECMLDDDVLSFWEECDTGKPLSANKVMIPEELANMVGYQGVIYGFIREDSGYHVIIGWEGNEPATVLGTSLIGMIGEGNAETMPVFIKGKWSGEKLEMFLCTKESEESVELVHRIINN